MREGGNYKKGMAAALACAVLWGFLPIYWKILDNIPSNIIIFYRIFWVGVTCFICCLKIYGYRQLKSYIKNKKEFFKFSCSAILSPPFVRWILSSADTVISLRRGVAGH